MSGSDPSAAPEGSLFMVVIIALWIHGRWNSCEREPFSGDLAN
jgi:hypothetical protein